MNRIVVCLATAACCCSFPLAVFGVTLPVTNWNTTIAASHPLNWYRLDELTGPAAIDYGSQGLNGTYGVGINAPIRGVPGPVGTGVAFDGNQQNIVFNGTDITGNWSAEFVLKKTGTKLSAELLRGIPLADPSEHLKLEQYPGTGQVGYTQSFVVDYTFSPAVVAPIGSFIDLVYVDDAGVMKAYVDGVLKGTNNTSIALPRYQFGDTGNESPFAVVDAIVIYNRALSASEIANHFSAVPEPGSITLALCGAFAGLLIWRRARLRSGG
jgi:Concanavalin A-like lectin/glucanases superfamily